MEVEFNMEIIIRKYEQKDLPEMMKIWNEVVEDGEAFPQENALTGRDAEDFFAAQTYCAIAQDTETGRILGLYILHPNNVGRCGHICNASYAVSSESRGLHIGEKLVANSLIQGKQSGFRLLQFNAVVEDNTHARHLYERLGFICLGTIPEGFRMNDGNYKDICLYYHKL